MKLKTLLKDFNLLATTSRGNEKQMCSELLYLLKEIGDSAPVGLRQHHRVWPGIHLRGAARGAGGTIIEGDPAALKGKRRGLGARGRVGLVENRVHVKLNGAIAHA